MVKFLLFLALQVPFPYYEWNHEACLADNTIIYFQVRKIETKEVKMVYPFKVDGVCRVQLPIRGWKVEDTLQVRACDERFCSPWSPYHSGDK